MPFTKTLWILWLSASAALAQSVVGAQAGTIQFVTGEVLVDGLPVHPSPVHFPALKDGQVLQTGRGRAEVTVAPEVFLRLGTRSAVRLTDTQLTSTQVEQIRGRLLIEVVDTTKYDRLQVRFGETLTEFKGLGLYRFDAEAGVLSVFGGKAEVRVGDQKAEAGRGVAVRLASPLTTSKFNLKKVDNLQRWAAARSFYLFVSSREARAQQTHWEFTPTGWFWNRNYDARFYSAIAAAEYRRRLAEEERNRGCVDAVAACPSEARQPATSGADPTGSLPAACRAPRCRGRAFRTAL